MAPINLEVLIKNLVGAFDNFQQYWQQNTEESIHQLEVTNPHPHLHLRIQKETSENEISLIFTKNRFQSEVVQRVSIYFFQERNQLLSQLYLPESKGQVQQLIWSKNNEGYQAHNLKGEIQFEILSDVLHFYKIIGFSKREGPFQFRRCRFFAGWIEYPDPQNEDVSFKNEHLRLHDQGGIIAFLVPGDSKPSYWIELSQLIYAHKIPIMKLAIYHSPDSKPNIHSKAIAYTWADPLAKRLGVNIRTILSGWTLIEADYLNADNM